MTAPITSFTGPYRWLSNFHFIDIEFEGVIYPSVEHAYMAAKTLIPEERADILACKTSGQAKRHGMRVTLRPNWDNMSFPYMKVFNTLKYNDPELREKLLATEDAILIEGNTWGDKRWGAVWDDKNGWEGQNLLGHLLMDIRAELRIHWEK